MKHRYLRAQLPRLQPASSPRAPVLGLQFEAVDCDHSRELLLVIAFDVHILEEKGGTEFLKPLRSGREKIGIL